jgi:hypothetical protein
MPVMARTTKQLQERLDEHESVQACEYTAVLFTKLCAKTRIEISMGSVGDCDDNAVCETFQASIKKERIYRRPWPSRAQVRATVFECIEGWQTPRHSTLGHLSPAEHERHHDVLNTARVAAPGSPLPATAQSLPRSRSMFQPIALRPRRTVAEVRTEHGGLSVR